MKLALYGRTVTKKDAETLKGLFSFLDENRVDYFIERSYHEQIEYFFPINASGLFENADTLAAHEVDYMISLGGDGTLLETLIFVLGTGLPVLGVNMGRLGFLANVPKEGIKEALEQLMARRYSIEKRSLIELHSENGLFAPYNFALNDFTIHKRDTGSMIIIDTYLNGEFFTSYWADGIIVSTPTGSTAYSLSCGGPVIFPDSNNFVITPVAPHNLNIRPIIVSDSTVISFRVRGRGHSHLLSLDSRYEIIEQVKEIAIQKAEFSFNLVKLNSLNFIDTLREKLKWGLDNRNL